MLTLVFLWCEKQSMRAQANLSDFEKWRKISFWTGKDCISSKQQHLWANFRFPRSLMFYPVFESEKLRSVWIIFCALRWYFVQVRPLLQTICSELHVSKQLRGLRHSCCLQYAQSDFIIARTLNFYRNMQFLRNWWSIWAGAVARQCAFDKI